MNLNTLHESIIKESCLILEAGYGRVLNFNYDKFNTDPNPKILYLGRYKNKKTGKTLIGGINLNYLDDTQIEKLRNNLRSILRSGRTLKARWQAGNKLLPDIFPNTGGRTNRGGYRTYDSSMIHIRSQSTITPQDLAKVKTKTKKDKTVSKPVRATDKAAAPVSKPVRATDKAAAPVPKPVRATDKAKSESPKLEPKVEPEIDFGIEPTKEPLKSEKPEIEPEVEPDAKLRNVEAPYRGHDGRVVYEPEQDIEPEVEIEPSGFPQDQSQDKPQKPPKPIRTSKLKKKK